MTWWMYVVSRSPLARLGVPTQIIERSDDSTAADALSTAFSFLLTEEIAGALRSVGGEIRIISAEGGKHVLTD